MQALEHPDGSGDVYARRTRERGVCRVVGHRGKVSFIRYVYCTIVPAVVSIDVHVLSSTVLFNRDRAVAIAGGWSKFHVPRFNGRLLIGGERQNHKYITVGTPFIEILAAPLRQSGVVHDHYSHGGTLGPISRV